ncbi:MAG TPA: hypothetical protein VGD66_09130 [Allosphingosinicella sp.]
MSVLPEWVGVSVGTIDVFSYGRAMNEQSPIVSEFASPEEAAAYEQWLREKVAASLADERPSIPHDEVMAEMRVIIEAKGKPVEGC